MRNANLGRATLLAAAATLATLTSAWAAGADTSDDTKLAQSAAALHELSTDEAHGIPADVLERARGLVVIPNLIRGGFFVGGMRGRGVLTIRTASGEWSNPAFVTLTGGSIGWQFGAEAVDVALVFANERSVRNIESGKFTLGGDATAVAGPLGRRSTAAMTGRGEVYVYVLHGRGAFAGAAFEGTRLDVDQDDSASYYGAGGKPLGESTYATPEAARRFLDALRGAATLTQSEAPPPSQTPAQQEEAKTFPLDAPR